MSQILLPAGQSLRSIADRLGVPVGELQRHSGIHDAEAPLKVARSVEVPDGFLRSRATRKELRDAVTAESGRKGGMNMWLALDIEQKRTRSAGGMHAHATDDSEEDALGEARRAYLRFEDASNELAIELYDQASVTNSIDVRARAFAGQGCAYAQRHLLFGEAVERSRPHALSAAKGALLADPKLAAGRLAMALALEVGGTPADLVEAQAELERAVQVDPKAVWCWAELASLALRRGELDAARDLVDRAGEVGEPCPAATEIRAILAFRNKEVIRSIELLQQAIAETPTHAGLRARLATALRSRGDPRGAEAALKEALEVATTDRHRELIGRWAAGSTM